MRFQGFFPSPASSTTPICNIKTSRSRRHTHQPPPQAATGLKWLTAALALLVILIAGCGAPQGIIDSSPLLTVPSTVDFGNVTVGQSGTSSVQVTNSGSKSMTVSDVSVTGAGFALAGNISLPMTLQPSQSTSVSVTFSPAATGTSSGTLTFTSNVKGGGSKSVHLSGQGQSKNSGTLSGLTCGSSSITGAASDACTVTLSAAAGSNLAVSLSSNNNAVSVPSSVTVPAGATSAAFSATVSAVTSTQTATLTASAGGASQTFSIQLNPASAPAITVTPSSLSFGSVTTGTTATQSVTISSSGTSTLTVSAGTTSGTGFTLSGASWPLSLSPGQSATLQVAFAPTTTGTVNGSLTLTSNAAGGTSTVSLSGTGASPTAVTTLSGLTCSSSSLTGAVTDACSISLSGAAPAGGLAVALSSSSTAVSVPASVTVTAGATSASFTATASTVTTAQTVTLTASSGGINKTFSLQLLASTAQISVSPTSVAFGNVNVSTPTTQTVTVLSNGNAALTINSATLSGAGFTLSAPTFPITLNPGQTTSLQVTFNPTSATSYTGSLTINSNAASSGVATVSLSGTGIATTYSVALTWSAPSTSTDPVSGYEVYRAPGGSTTYQLLTPTPITLTTYTDASVATGQSYLYYVVSVDSSGNQSSPSNTYSATIP